jgi:double-stranded uracil-DNA glycosylase
VTVPRRPSRTDIAAAHNATVKDVVAPGLGVLLCGINPGLYSGAVGHHFARPGNRLWRALHAAGYTPRVLTAFEEQELLDYGVGITNLVDRATASAAELRSDELVAGARALERKVRRLRPRFVAFLGLGAYRTAFGRRDAAIGPQATMLGEAGTWLLPNPSGLNARYQVPELARAFSELRRAAWP